jgi:nitrite reductase/ring-hydroxylating ferredoxin subunit
MFITTFSGAPIKIVYSFAEIANGEGKVVKYEDQTIALYKDEHGNLHAVNPVCTGGHE